MLEFGRSEGKRYLNFYSFVNVLDLRLLGGSFRRIRKDDPKASVSILILYHNGNILSRDCNRRK
jgi:hypothetical protein